jgi:hypothetical protein
VVHADPVGNATRVTIELDGARGSQLAGRLLSGNGEARRFDGWLELISMLDAELSPADVDPPANDAESPGEAPPRTEG